MSDLWILAGQSNMEGVGDLIEVEPASTRVRSFVHGDQWQTAEEPLHWLLEANDTVHWCGHTDETIAQERVNTRASRTKGAGLGLPFAKHVAEATGHEIDLVPCAHGGTSMEQWNPAHKHQGGASLFGATLRRVRLALETQPEAVLKGILWYQGESDANDVGVSLFHDGMVRLINAFREELKAPGLPFLQVQLGTFAVPDNDTDPNKKAWSQIRELQRLLPGAIENVVTVPALDLSLDDAIHISTPGLKRLGIRMANAALGGFYGQKAPTPITLDSVTRDGFKVRVKFAGVNGALRAPDSGGRVPGFAIDRGGRPDENVIYKALLDAPDTVVLSINDWEGLEPGAKLWYGYGYAPFCQLVDSADMAAPAFGPVDL